MGTDDQLTEGAPDGLVRIVHRLEPRACTHDPAVQDSVAAVSTRPA